MDKVDDEAFRFWYADTVAFSNLTRLEAVRAAWFEATRRCAQICLYGDIAETPIPADANVDEDDPEAWTRAECAYTILAE